MTTQLIIVYVIVAAVAVITLCRIYSSIASALKSKKPPKCAGCYLKDSCGVSAQNLNCSKVEEKQL